MSFGGIVVLFLLLAAGAIALRRFTIWKKVEKESQSIYHYAIQKGADSLFAKEIAEEFILESYEIIPSVFAEIMWNRVGLFKMFAFISEGARKYKSDIENLNFRDTDTQNRNHHSFAQTRQQETTNRGIIHYNELKGPMGTLACSIAMYTYKTYIFYSFTETIPQLLERVKQEIRFCTLRDGTRLEVTVNKRNGILFDGKHTNIHIELIESKSDNFAGAIIRVNKNDGSEAGKASMDRYIEGLADFATRLDEKAEVIGVVKPESIIFGTDKLSEIFRRASLIEIRGHIQPKLAEMFFSTRNTAKDLNSIDNVCRNLIRLVANHYADNISRVDINKDPLCIYARLIAGDESIINLYEEQNKDGDAVFSIAGMFARDEVDETMIDPNGLLIAAYELLTRHIYSENKSIPIDYDTMRILLEKVFFDNNIKESDKTGIGFVWSNLAVVCSFNDYIYEKYKISLSDVQLRAEDSDYISR